LNPRRLKGELLHPEHEPADVLLELKREMGAFAFNAQYQQSPFPPGGKIIRRKWLTTYDSIGQRAGDRLIMSWDIALSEAETGDYSACVVLLMRGEVFYVLEVVRGRFPFGTLKRKVMEVNPATLLIEDSPISRGLIQSLREQSINVTTHKPETDKQSRVIAQTDLFAGGSVRFPRKAAWLEDTSALHVVERYRLIDYEATMAAVRRDLKVNAPLGADLDATPDPDYRGPGLQLEFTVEDEGVFTTPWTATITYRRGRGPWREFICAENRRESTGEKETNTPMAERLDF
jgi:phage terminase large subunit-like protein